MRKDELNLTAQTTTKLVMVLAWCIQSKEYRERVLPQLPPGEPLVDMLNEALSGDSHRLRKYANVQRNGRFQESVTEDVIQIMRLRGEDRELQRKRFELRLNWPVG